MTHRRPRMSAFTLIELLVVITIIALLISILLPALKQARLAGYAVREQAAAQQKSTAWHNYATDNKDAAFTGYIPWAVAHLGTTPSPLVWLHPDPWFPNHVAEGNVIKIAGLRFMGASGMPMEALQLDRGTFQDFMTRPIAPTFGPGSSGGTPIPNAPTPPSTLYDGNIGDRAAAMAFHPSLGFNHVYVGGDWSHGAMPNFASAAGTGVARIGHPAPKKFYVTHLHEVQKPDTLLLMASTRAVDAKTTGSYGGGSNYGRNPFAWSAASTIVPGFWELLPPRTGYPTNSTTVGWQATNTFRDNTNPTDWGYLHPRHSGRAVTAMIDGHVSMQKIQDLRDMRKWANKANRPDWTFTP